jgi:Ca-activated chloride channel family protein
MPMNDKDLERLKSLPVPAPRKAARADALAAAHAAFDAAQADGADKENFESNPTQGTSEPLRLTGTSTGPQRSTAMQDAGSRKMFTPRRLAMAASIAALIVAAPAAFYGIAERDRQPAPPPPEGGRAITVTELPARQQSTDKTRTAPADADRRLIDRAKEIDGTDKQRADTGRAKTDEAKLSKLKDQLLATPASSAPPQNQPRIEREERLAPHLRRLSQSDRLALGGTNSVAGIVSAPARSGESRQRRFANIQPLPEPVPRQAIEQNRDKFDAKADNPVKSVAQEPVSTFSIDVDTASYSFVRRALNGGRLPPKAAVRVEEMINYFPYEYARPEGTDAPFRANVEVFPSPWNATNQLVHIAIKGYELKSAERPRANLVFLIDVSGSMAPQDRLPLVQNGLRMLLDTLRPQDTVAIVTYASGSGVRLQPTKIEDKAKILAAIDGLSAGGSTAGARGIEDAYKLAEANYDKAAVNRVILATDGDFNVGITDRDALKGYIERKRESGIHLSILGVGQGNHNDALMQTLAQNGNGVAAYVDTLNEARKVLVDEASSTLFPIAKDVKIQFEFNPARVAEYRLIGYETRMLARADFNNDKVDAGDVGSGHAVTAIYEITPVGGKRLVEDLRYSQPKAAATDAKASELGFLKLRYKLPKEDASRLMTFAVGNTQTKPSIAAASTEARFSTAVAAFGQLLRGLPYMQSYTFDDVIALANGAKGNDPFGYRAEFVNLARLAKSARP